MQIAIPDQVRSRPYMAKLSDMATVKYLKVGTQMPEVADGETWMVVECFDKSGRFYGTGEGRKPTGDMVLYASLSEHNTNLDTALAAATAWAESHQVETIYVQTDPTAPRHGDDSES